MMDVAYSRLSTITWSSRLVIFLWKIETGWWYIRGGKKYIYIYIVCMYNIYTSVVKVIKDSRFRVTVFFQDFVIFKAVFFDSMQVSTPPPPPLPPTLFQRVSVQSRKVMIAPLLTLCVAFRVTRGAFFDHARAQLEAIRANAG